jgi:hypothetical protein
MPTRIIGLGHRSRMGKDTVATLLHAALKLDHGKLKVKTVSFASKIKSICHELYGWAGVKDEQHYENYPEDRATIIPYFGHDVVTLWIKFGTPAIREQVHQNTWVDYIINTNHKCDVLIVKDVRFYNEADPIIDAGGWVYKIHNPRVPYRDSVADNALEDYPRFTGTLINDSDIKHLNDLVVEQIIGRYEAS